MQQTSTKRIPDSAWQGWKNNPLGIVQEAEMWPYWQIVLLQTRKGNA